VAVATMGIAAPPSRLRRLLFRVSLGERGRLTLARTAGLGQEPFQLGDAGVALAETLVQLGKLANVALEQFTQMGDLSDQLLVGTGFCARRSVVCRNSHNTCRVCSGGGPRYPSTSSDLSGVRLSPPGEWRPLLRIAWPAKTLHRRKIVSHRWRISPFTVPRPGPDNGPSSEASTNVESSPAITTPPKALAYNRAASRSLSTNPR